MLSRTANSIYWMGRYLERADNIARFVYVNTHLILDMGWERDARLWEPLIYASGDDLDFNERYKSYAEHNVIRFLTFDNKNPNSILTCIQNARENARTVREVISSEMWEAINALYHLVEKYSRKRSVDELQELPMKIRDASLLFAGLAEDSMSHNEGWHFLRMGRMLERADKTARMLDVKYFLLLPSLDYVNSPYDAIEWGAVLKSVGGFKMYCKQFHRVKCRDVSQFLIFNSEFPRSIYYSIHAAADSLQKITEILNITVPAQKEMVILQEMLYKTSIDGILQYGLHEFIDILQFNLNVVDECLFNSFFTLETNKLELTVNA